MIIFIRRRNLISKYIAVLFLILNMIFVTGCNKITDTSHQLRVGMECAYAPFNWSQQTDKNGAVPIGKGEYAAGYDVEIAKILAEKLGRELVIVKTMWDGLLPALTSGKIDVILGGMSATEVRKYTIDFSDRYYTSDLVIVVRKDSSYANAKLLSDFAGAKITAQMNTIHYECVKYIKDVDKQPPRQDFPSMIVGVSSGEIDGFVSESPGAMSAIFTNPNLTYVEFEEGKGFNLSEDEKSIAIGMKKNNPLKKDINKALREISEEKRKELMQQAVKNQSLVNL